MRTSSINEGTLFGHVYADVNPMSACPKYAVREIGGPDTQPNSWRRVLFHDADMKDQLLETGELVIVCKELTSPVSPRPAFAFLG